MTPPNADVGAWVRMDNRTEHRIAKRVRDKLGGHLETDCGLSLMGPWQAIMMGPTREACPVCRKMAES